MDSRYDNDDQESSDGNGSDLKNVYNMYFCSVNKTTFRYFVLATVVTLKKYTLMITFSSNLCKQG